MFPSLQKECGRQKSPWELQGVRSATLPPLWLGELIAIPRPAGGRKEPPQGQLASLAKEIQISLSETLPFYIKHIQSVNGRETIKPGG